MSLRTELEEYIELLEHLDRTGEGIDGDAVPRELRDILQRAPVETAPGGSELILSLVRDVHLAAMDRLGDHEMSGWSTARRSSWTGGVIFAKQALRTLADTHD